MLITDKVSEHDYPEKLQKAENDMEIWLLIWDLRSPGSKPDSSDSFTLKIYQNLSSTLTM